MIKGVMFEEDLERYALQTGLPAGYGRMFIEQVGGSTSRALIHCDTSAREASLEKFKVFSNAGESALRRAFAAFDRDADGRISVEDLEATLAYISINCPKTRCVYRCRKHVVKQLLCRVKLDGNRPVPFHEFKHFFLLLPGSSVMAEYWLSRGCVSLCDVDSKVRVHEEQKGSPWGHLFAGAVAGAASRTATAPLETLRLAAMAGTLPAANLAAATTTIVRRDGWRGLYKGNLLNVIRAAPQKALDFFAFDLYKQLLAAASPPQTLAPSPPQSLAPSPPQSLAPSPPQSLAPSPPQTLAASPLQTLAAAGLAGATSWVLLYPLEVVRSRITCDISGQYQAGIVAAFRTVVQREGPGTLVRGLGPSVAAIIPEAAICYGLQDLLKQAYRSLHGGAEPSVALSMGMGVFSAFMGQLVSFPLESVSRRMQVGACHQDVWCAIRQLASEGGLPAFYRGVGASTLRLVPMALVSFGAYEATRAFVMDMEERQRLAEYDKHCPALLYHSAQHDGAHSTDSACPLAVAQAAAAAAAREGEPAAHPAMQACMLQGAEGMRPRGG